ncbi:MAG TPA: hypothetical protein VF520_07415, partial [Thermoleophilaceae bacterium]
RVAGPRHARPRERERDQLLGRLSEPAERVRPDESGVELAAPAEARLDRVAVLGQVVAVQVEAGLDPQRVARAEPGTPIEIDVRGKSRAAEVRKRPLYSKET